MSFGKALRVQKIEEQVANTFGVRAAGPGPNIQTGAILDSSGNVVTGSS